MDFYEQQTVNMDRVKLIRACQTKTGERKEQREEVRSRTR